MQYFNEYLLKLYNIHNIKEIKNQIGGQQENIKIIIGNYKDYNPSKIVSEKEKKQSINKDDLFVSAYLEDTVVGSLRVKYYNNSYIINDVYVLPEYRGLGIGKKLMITIIDHLKNKKIVLYVDPKNKVALNLYKKLNFKLIKENMAYGDKYKYQSDNIDSAFNKVDNYLLSIYREFNKNPRSILKYYTLADILKYKEVTKKSIKTNNIKNITNINDQIFEEIYDYKQQRLSAITDYFIYPCRMKCLVEGQKSTAYNIFIDELSKNKNLNYTQKKDVLYKMRKHKNCTLLPFRKLIHILKIMMNNKADIKYIDCSAGWGDRMIAALLSGVSEYIAYDPNTCLKQGHSEIINYFKNDLFGYYGSNNKFKNYNVIYKPFEKDYDNEGIFENYFDICISSPPFFTVEIYSTESTQSTSNYKTADAWLYNFLIPSFKKIMRFLKSSGFICWYIEDREEYKFLDTFFNEIDKLNICKYINKIGYTYDDIDIVRYFYIWQKN